MSTQRDIDGLADTQIPDSQLGSGAASQLESAAGSSDVAEGSRPDVSPLASDATADGREPEPAGETSSGSGPRLGAGSSRGSQPSSSQPGGAGAAYEQKLPVEDRARYKVAREYARGGLGRVMEAQDQRLGRTVAIKELLRVSEFAESLFVREALITARLQHPGIVPVHEAGRWPSGEPFYVMKLVSGSSLRKRLHKAKTLEERLAYLPNVIAVVEAIAYAHSESILHRDIKPGNVMIGEFGETVVVDWGLARDDKQPVPFARDLADIELASLDGEESDSATVWLQIGNYSVSGKVVGTPTYMAPEQASGDEVTHKADIYALGSMLYEILAGAPPYPGKDPQVVLEKVLAGPPQDLSERGSHVPGELITIVQKAMARDPNDRYQSAKDLAEDLKLFQTGKLVSSHEYTTWTLMRRWLWRHRSAVAVALTALAILLVLGAVGLDRVFAAKDRAEAEKQIATTRTHKATALQAKLWLSRDPTATVAWLKQLPLEGKWLTKARQHYREAMAAGVARHVIAHDSWVWKTVFHPDGKHVISASHDGTVRLIRVDNGAECVLERAHEHNFRALAVSKNGAWVAAGNLAGDIRLLELGAGYQVESAKTLSGHSRRVATMLLTDDGRLLSSSWDSTLRVWDMRTGKQIDAIAVDRFNVTISPDGTRVATRRGNQVIVLDVASKAETLQLEMPSPATQMRFSPDGQKLAVLTASNTMHLVDIADKTVVELGSAQAVQQLNVIAFSPSGRWLATPTPDWGIALWDLSGQKEARVLRGHSSFFFSLEFSRDETILVSSSDDDTARVWDLRSGQVQVLRGHADDVSSAALDPTGTVLATSGLDHTVRIWMLRSGSGHHLGRLASSLRALHFTPNGELTALSGAGEVQRWDASRDRSEVLVPAGAEQRWSFPSRDGSRVLRVRLGNRGAFLVSLAAGTVRALPPDPEGKFTRVKLSDNGEQMIVADEEGVLEVRSLDSEKVVHLARPQPVCGFALSPDKASLAIVTQQAVELIDLQTRATLQSAPFPNTEPSCRNVQRRAVLFAPDGSWVAIGGAFHGLRLWNLADNTLRDLEVGRNHVVLLAASPDSEQLAVSLRQDRTVRVWSSITGAGKILDRHHDLPRALAFSPDSRYLASAGHDDMILVWDSQNDDVRRLRGHTDNVECIAFSPDSAELASGARDGSIRIWNLQAAPAADGGALGALLELGTSAEIDDTESHRPRTPRGARGTGGGPPCKDHGPLADAEDCNPCQP